MTTPVDLQIQKLGREVLGAIQRLPIVEKAEPRTIGIKDRMMLAGEQATRLQALLWAAERQAEAVAQSYHLLATEVTEADDASLFLSSKNLRPAWVRQNKLAVDMFTKIGTLREIAMNRL